MDTHALWQLFLHLLDVSAPAMALVAGLVIGTYAERRRYPKGKAVAEQYDVIELSTEEPEIEGPREDFFKIDGKMYTIPVEVPPHIALMYLNLLRNNSADRAVSKVMDVLIGEEGVKALARCKAITKDQTKVILGRVQKKVEGLMEEVTGN